MEVEIFTLCDYAQDTQGKLTIVGTFDVITSNSFPLVYPQCSIAGRLRFSDKEIGKHKFKVLLEDEQKSSLFNPIEGEIQINKPNVGNHSTINFAFNLGQLKFDAAGKYSFSLFIDDEWKTGLSLILVKQ